MPKLLSGGDCRGAVPQASDVSKAAWLSAKKEMWRKERRHTEIMAGVGKQTKQAAQCRRDTLSHPSSPLRQHILEGGAQL